MPTVRVMPWGSDQGDFVVIDAADFDPSVHKPFVVAAELSEEERQAAADAVIKAANAHIPESERIENQPAAVTAAPKKGKG